MTLCSSPRMTFQRSFFCFPRRLISKRKWSILFLCTVKDGPRVIQKGRCKLSVSNVSACRWVMFVFRWSHVNKSYRRHWARWHRNVLVSCINNRLLKSLQWRHQRSRTNWCPKISQDVLQPYPLQPMTLPWAVTQYTISKCLSSLRQAKVGCRRPHTLRFWTKRRFRSTFNQTRHRLI